MKKKLIATFAALTLGFGAIFTASPSYAGFNPFAPIDGFYHLANNVVNSQVGLARFALGALVVGSVINAIAASSHPRPGYAGYGYAHASYVHYCRKVYYTRNCRQAPHEKPVCYIEKHVNPNCH